jgi:hypothetical protein
MSEGMELGEGVCAALLRILCSRQELELAADVVSIIKARQGGGAGLAALPLRVLSQRRVGWLAAA